VRTLLITGPGGAGRTTVAVATAHAAARAGQRVLVLTADRSRDLDALLCTPLAPSGGVPIAPGATAVPVRRIPGLWAARMDAQLAFREGAADVQRRLGSVLDLLGTEPLAEEELTELPGAQPLALLRALSGAAADQDGVPWDTVVVDLPPLHAALAALALPEQLRRYLGRLLPPERQAARALRPVLAQLAGVPMPAEAAFAAAERADIELGAAEAVIRDRRTTVRLVVEPGPRAAEAVRTARVGLALYGHRLTDVVANRLLPAEQTPRLAERQREYLKALDAELAEDTRVRELPYVEDPAVLADPAVPAGLAGLTGLAIPDDEGGDGPAPQPWTVEDRLAADGRLVWRLPLPGADRDTLDLVRRGDELVLDADGFRRIIPLPSVLRRCTVAGAALRDGALSVRFAPDPGLWPSQLG
jgi:arsenite-transporting ATPase